MNLLTLNDARNAVGRFVEAGSCNTTTIDARITEACARLLPKADWVHTVQVVRIRTNNTTFPLPRECSAIRHVSIDNSGAYIRSQAYEFMAAGPGEIQHYCEGSGLKDLVDMGFSAFMYDIPPIESFATDETDCTNRTVGDGYYIAAFTTEQKDLAQTIEIHGWDRVLNEVGSGTTSAFVPGETLALNYWATEGVINGPLSDLKLSTSTYRQLHSWVKPLTKGYISLYAVNPSNNYVWFLGKAHPDDTVPMWRRYKIVQQAFDDNANILAVCKLGACPLTHANDILPIQNLYAIKLMVQAIREENARQKQQALAYEADAVRLLVEQKQDHQKGRIVMIDQEAELSGGHGLYSDMII